MPPNNKTTNTTFNKDRVKIEQELPSRMPTRSTPNPSRPEVNIVGGRANTKVKAQAGNSGKRLRSLDSLLLDGSKQASGSHRQVRIQTPTPSESESEPEHLSPTKSQSRGGKEKCNAGAVPDLKDEVERLREDNQRLRRENKTLKSKDAMYKKGVNNIESTVKIMKRAVKN